MRRAIEHKLAQGQEKEVQEMGMKAAAGAASIGAFVVGGPTLQSAIVSANMGPIRLVLTTHTPTRVHARTHAHAHTSPSGAKSNNGAGWFRVAYKMGLGVGVGAFVWCPGGLVAWWLGGLVCHCSGVDILIISMQWCHVNRPDQQVDRCMQAAHLRALLLGPSPCTSGRR